MIAERRPARISWPHKSSLSRRCPSDAVARATLSGSKGGAMKPALERLLDRRSFFTSMGKAAAGASAFGLMESDLEAIQQTVQRNSVPSELKITDMRVAVVEKAPMTCPLIRLDTNQGITGHGEVR